MSCYSQKALSELLSEVGKGIPKKGLGNTMRWLMSRVTETFTVDPHVHGGAGLRLVVKYCPELALTRGEATDNI